MEASLKSGELFVAVLCQLKNKMFDFVIKEEKQRANVSVLSHGPLSHSVCVYYLQRIAQRDRTRKR
jgi:hypothetical protein